MNAENWQAALDSDFIARLMRPLNRSGVISSDLGNAIIARTEQMTNHLPMLVQFAQRQAGIFQLDDIPIVYAQPAHSVEIINAPASTTELSTTIQVIQLGNRWEPDETDQRIEPSASKSVANRPFQTSSNISKSNVQNSPIVFAQIPQDVTAQAPIVLNQNTFNQNSFNHVVQSAQTQAIASPIPLSSSSQIHRGNFVQPSSTAFFSRLIQNSELERLTQKAAFIETHASDLPFVQPEKQFTGSPLPIVPVRAGVDSSAPMRSEKLRRQGESAIAASYTQQIATPMIFAHPATPAQPVSSSPTSHFPVESLDWRESTRSRLDPHFSPSLSETRSSDAPPMPINVDAIATQVERKLMRRLVIESERRGQTRWR